MKSIVRKLSAATILTLAVAAQASSALAQRAVADGQTPEARATARATTKNCGNLLQRTLVRQSSVSQSTSSVSAVDVVDSAITFTTVGPPSAGSCVLVSFSAQAFAPGPGAVMRVRARLDNVTSVDGEIQMVAESDSSSDAHAYTFLSPSVLPGVHRLVMQYRSVNNDEVFINDFNVTVRHR